MNGYCYPADIHATTIARAQTQPPANRSEITSAKTTTSSKIHSANRAENPKQLEHKEKQALITTGIHRKLYHHTNTHTHIHRRLPLQVYFLPWSVYMANTVSIVCPHVYFWGTSELLKWQWRSALQQQE